MQEILSSDVVLVGFSLLLGGLVGVFWERARVERLGGAKDRNEDRSH